MDPEKDALQYLSMDRWSDLQKAFRTVWPRGVSGYYVLDAQRKWKELGCDYGFKVYCPFGDVWNGMVAFNQKNEFYEIIIQCPTNDTSKLEEALKQTRLIDWRKYIIVPFTPKPVIDCLQKVVDHVGSQVERVYESESFYMDRTVQLPDVNLPSNITFDILTTEHIELVDSVWPHKYPGSIWYFDLLIRTKSGFGLFQDNCLTSWVFVNEAGTLGHVYTVEEHRRKGHAELLLKLLCKKLLGEKRDVFAFCVKGNEVARRLYLRTGFEQCDAGVAWCYLRSKNE